MINIKADREVKKNAQKLAKELGLNLSTIINANLKQFIRSREVYFSVMPKMTSELERLVGQARKDYKAKKNISPVFNSVQEALDYLHS